MTNKEVNRRTIENFIKSGAMDSLPGTRRQKVAVAPILLDNKARERKNAWEGQMSLFDLVSEEEKKEYQVSFPDVESIPRKSCWLLKRIFWAYTSAVIH